MPRLRFGHLPSTFAGTNRTDRYYSNTTRVVAVVAAIFVSLTYVAGQMRGVGIVFSRFLQVDIATGVAIGMVIVGCFAVLGGMKGIAWTQIAQYGVLIIAFLIPAFALAFMLTGNPIPQLAFTWGDIVPKLKRSNRESGIPVTLVRGGKTNDGFNRRDLNNAQFV